MIKLTKEFAEQRGRSLVQLIEQDVRDATRRYARIKESRALYYGTATANMPLPWEGASNIHLPIVQEKVEGLVPMLLMAYWGIDPVVNVSRSPSEFDGEQTDTVEQYLNYVFEKDIPNMYESFESWMRNTVTDGVSVMKPYWSYMERAVSEIHTMKSAFEVGAMTPVGEAAPAARFKSGLELLIEIFGPLENITCGLIVADMVKGVDEVIPMGTEWQVQFTEDRKVYDAYVRFYEGERIDEIRAKVRRHTVVRDCTMCDVLEYDDVIVPYRTIDLQTADRITQKYWLTVDDIVDKVKDGEWDLSDEDVALLRGTATANVNQQGGVDTGLSKQKDNVIGESKDYGSESVIDLPAGFKPYNRNKVLILLVHLCDAVEEDGSRYEVIYHIPYALRRIARADFLDEEYPHGKRPFVAAKYLPVSDTWFALGMGDQLAAINLECNTIINYINNNQELINNPFGFYEPSAFTADMQGIRRIAPGQMVPVQSVQGILFPKFQQQPLSNFESMTSLLMFADRLTISPMSLGSSQMKNAPRTARGTVALLGEGHVKTDMLITRMQRGAWMELVEQVHGLHMELGSDEKWYYITRESADRKPKRISRAQLRGRYEYRFRGNTVNTNRDVLRNMAQVRYAMAMQNPDGARDPVFRQNAWRDFLTYWGEGTDIDRLIPALPGTEGFEHPPLSQEEENQAMRLGILVSVLPTDNHAIHLQKMDMFEHTNEFATFPAHAVGVYAAHKRGHQEFMSQQLRMAQMPVSPGMGNNIPQGMTLTGGDNDTGVMEGGNMR